MNDKKQHAYYTPQRLQKLLRERLQLAYRNAIPWYVKDEADPANVAKARKLIAAHDRKVLQRRQRLIDARKKAADPLKKKAEDMLIREEAPAKILEVIEKLEKLGA